MSAPAPVPPTAPPAAAPAPSASRVAFGRCVALLYGALAYAGFLVTFLYAIGFVHDVFVPTSLERGAAADSTLQAVLINVGLLLAFGVQHNVMARPAFKRAWTRVVSPAVERSTFVVATVLAFALLFTQWRPLPELVWQVEQPLAVWTLHALAAAGWLTVLVSTFLIDHFGLFGLRQVWAHFRGVAPNPPAFHLRGTYRWVRHPLMLGFLVAFWATPSMSQGHLLFAAVVTGWVLFALQLEERDLIAEHGDDYRAYKARVPGLLPWPRPRG